MAKTIFHDFEKETLIAFIQEQGSFLRFKKDELLRRLRHLEWDRKAKELQETMDKAVKDMQEADASTLAGMKKWQKARADFDKALKQSRVIDRKYHVHF